MIEHAPKPKSRWLRWLLATALFLVFLFALALAYLWIGVSPKLPQGPVRIVRGPDGRFAAPEDAEKESGLDFEALAAATRSNNRLSAASSTASSEGTRFACRRILILNLSDHLLMQRVGPSLLEHLTALSNVDEISYIPGGTVTEHGGMAPDVIITLDMPEVEEVTHMAERRLHATVVARAGTTLFTGSRNYVDDLTPPNLQFQWQGTLIHESTTTGIASRAARYKPQADGIARQLGDALVKLLAGYRERYGLMPDVPAAFFPPYRPAGPLPFLDGYEIEPLASWRRLMVPNESFWRLRASVDAGQVLRDIRAKMENAGWRVDAAAANAGSSDLRAERGSVVVSIFPPGDRSVGPGAPADADSAAVLYVHYLDRMARKELERAIDGTLTEQTPTDVLMLFRRYWSRPQRLRALDLLRARRLDRPQDWLTVADMCHGLGRDAQAREALARAAALLLVTERGREEETRARDIARRLDAENVLDAPPTPATLTAAGFVELLPGAPPTELELAVNEPARFFVKEPDGQVSALSVSIVRDTSGTDAAPYQLSYVESSGGGKSWGRLGTMTAQREFTHQMLLSSSTGRAQVTVRQTAGAERFLVTVRLIPRGR